MSTPNDPYATGGTPEEPGTPQDPTAPQPPASPQYPTQPPAAPQYPTQPTYGTPPPAPQYGSTPPAPQYGSTPPAPQYGSTPYGAAPQYGAAAYPPPQYGNPGAAAPNNYLVWAILTTVLCCLPLGIPSIVFASQVNSKWAQGDIAGAMASSVKARQFAMWGAIVGGIGIVLYIGFFVVAGIAGSNTSY